MLCLLQVYSKVIWIYINKHLVSKFGKLSRGHNTGKGQFSFQSQRRAMPKNAQATVQLQSFHVLAKSCSNSPNEASTVHEPGTSSCSNWI